MPAPNDTDADYLVLIRQDAGMVDLDHRMRAEGYALGGSLPTDEINAIKPDEQFWSYTKGEVNFIITKSPIFFKRFMVATSVSKRLNLLHKQDRIALFQAVLYGNC